MRTRRTIRSALVVVLVASTLLVRGAAPAQACSCAGPGDEPIEVEVARAEGAFVGTVIDIGRPPPFSGSNHEVPHRFAVESVAAGDIGREVVVQAASEGASCGLELRVGQRTGLFVSRLHGHWTGGLCGRVDAGRLAAVGRPPDPSIPIPADGIVASAWDTARGGGSRPPVLALAAGALLVAAAAGVLVGRRRTRARTRNDPAPS